MKHAGIAALIILGLVGCGGTTTATPSETPPESVSAPAASPVANDDPCAVLSADEINAVLGTTFEAGKSASDAARDTFNCTYTMMVDVAGAQVPGSIVDVGLTNVSGAEAFDTNKDLALSYFGNDPQDVTVQGATKAYVVNNAETDSPVIGMLVGERYALIQIGVEGATVEQAQQLAQTAATRLG